MAVTFASNKLIENQSMAASFQSEAIPLIQKQGFSVHAIFTGSPVGSLYLAASIDGINWTVITDSPQAVSAAGDVFFNIRDTAYLSARLHYAATSGTGSLNAFFSTKGHL